MANKRVDNSVFSREFDSKMDPMFRSDWRGKYKESLNIKPARQMLKFVNRGRR